jgi:uncharacterized protein
MIIDLASVGKTPKPMELTFGPADIELDEGTRIVDEATFQGQIKRDEVRTLIDGHISARIATDCVRCLEPVEKPIEIDFDDVFIDAENEPKDDEVEVAPSELDVALLTDSRIDMAEVVREQLVLATDELIICREDCKGLCPKCGGNRNLIDCKCEDNEIDPRWAALKNLN